VFYEGRSNQATIHPFTKIIPKEIFPQIIVTPRPLLTHCAADYFSNLNMTIKLRLAVNTRYRPVPTAPAGVNLFQLNINGAIKRTERLDLTAQLQDKD
jgi:hypothetical protein